MDRESVVPRPQGLEWETPAAEEIRVSAEVTAYMGTWMDQDWM
jgi:coenzyme PQQ precursor peptide PqqA